MDKDKLKKVIGEIETSISNLKSREMSSYMIGRIDGLSAVLNTLEKLYASEEEEGEGKMKAKWVAEIRENDERGGDIVRIGIDLDAKYDGQTGCRVIAENGDDVGYYSPRSEEECMSDIETVWGRWDTFKWLM